MFPFHLYKLVEVSDPHILYFPDYQHANFHMLYSMSHSTICPCYGVSE